MILDTPQYTGFSDISVASCTFMCPASVYLLCFCRHGESVNSAPAASLKAVDEPPVDKNKG